MRLEGLLSRLHNSKHGIFFTLRDNLMINVIFELLSSRAIQNILDLPGYL